VVDAGSSRSPFVRRLWQVANVVLVVTTPEPAAIRESYAAIKVLTDAEVVSSLHTLVNRATPAEALDVQWRIGEACRRFLGLRAVAAGNVETCPATGSDEPVLIYPAKSASARALDRVADTLWAPAQRARGSDATVGETGGGLLAEATPESCLALAGETWEFKKRVETE
jgi:MinD-like ATPase involved in chromosome partitioning or flagellar assembly